MRRVLSISLFCAFLISGCVTEGGDEVNKQSPKDAAAYNYQLGVEYLRQDKLQQARDRLESAVVQDTTHSHAHFTLAILYTRLGEEALADKSYRNALKAAPNDAAVQNSYAIYLCGKEKYSDAENYFRRAARNPLYQTPAAALTNAGLCMQQKPDLVAAENYFREAMQVDGTYPAPLVQLAALKLNAGNALSARAFVQRYLDTFEPTAEVLLLGWQIENELDDRVAARNFARDLARDFPETREARSVAGGGR